MTRMTKQQLVDEHIRLRAHCDVLERKIAELQAPQHTRQPHSGRPDPRDYGDYYQYVAAERAFHRDLGIRVISYCDRTTWAAAQGH